MSRTETVTARIEEDTMEWVEGRARATGKTRSEFVCRLIDVYQASEEGEVSCPDCGRALLLTPGVLV